MYLPPCETVYQQTQRWLNVGVFEAIVHDLRVLLRLAAVHTLGHLLGLHVTAADARTGPKWRSWLSRCKRLRAPRPEVAFVDQGYTGDQPAEVAAVHGICSSKS